MYQGDNAWIQDFLNTIIPIAAVAIMTYAGGAAAAWAMGPAVGSAGAPISAVGPMAHASVVAGRAATGATVATYTGTGGDWEAALYAGIVTFVTSYMASYFKDLGTTPDSLMGDYEYDAWANSPAYEQALYSTAANGSTPLWYEGVLDTFKKFAAKYIVKGAVKLALGYAGIDGSQNGHATFSFDSSNERDLFDILAPLMADIAPQKTKFNIGLGGGAGGFPAEDGIDYVPYDNFRARLHKGERVQTAPEAEQWRSGGGRPSIGEIKIYLDGEEVKGRMEVIADGVVVGRNRRGVDATTRIYN